MSFDAARVVPAAEVEDRAQGAARERRIRRPFQKAVHAPVLVRLEVQEDHILELAGIEHLRDALADTLVHPVHPRVDESRALIVDQDLVELKLRVWKLDSCGDPVDPIDELVNAGHAWCSSLSANI